MLKESRRHIARGEGVDAGQALGHRRRGAGGIGGLQEQVRRLLKDGCRHMHEESLVIGVIVPCASVGTRLLE